MTKAVLEAHRQADELIRYVTDRPGHDRRYAVDCSKAESDLGWAPTVTFEQGLAETVAWYKANAAWVDRVKSGAYRSASKKKA